MSLLDDFSELRLKWKEVGVPTRLLLLLTTSTSIISAFSVVDNLAFEFTSSLLRLVDRWRKFTEPLRDFLAIGYPSRPLTTGEMDFLFLFSFFILSVYRTLYLFDGRKFPFLVLFGVLSVPFVTYLFMIGWREAAMSGYSLFSLFKLLPVAAILISCFGSSLLLFAVDRQMFMAVSINILVVIGSALVLSGLLEGVSRALASAVV